MTTVVTEVETKYVVTGQAPMPALELLPHVQSVERRTSDLRATYFDTDDLALLRSGITLRRREGGHDPGWHLKLPDRGRRHEVRLPLDGATDPPARFVAITQVVHGGRPLRPVAEIDTRREATRLLDHAGSPFAEVADDRVRAQRLLPPVLTTHWREWELELEGEPGTAAAEADRLLLAAGAKRAQHANKLARVLSVHDHAHLRSHEAPPLPDDPSAGEVVGRYLAREVGALTRLDPLARADVPDAVHRMRVAGRRLRSTLRTYRRLLHRDVTDPIRAEVGWVVDVLGRPRDREVLQERLSELLGRHGGAVEARLDEEHHRDHVAAMEALGSARYLSLLESLARLDRTPPWRHRAARPARTELPRLLRPQVDHLVATAEAAEAAAGPEATAAALHDVRRSAKRVRYAVEAALPALGDEAAGWAADLAELQDVLGTHHDAVVARQELRELAPALPPTTVLTGLHDLDADADRAAARYHRLVGPLLRQRRRRWLDPTRSVGTRPDPPS